MVRYITGHGGLPGRLLDTAALYPPGPPGGADENVPAACVRRAPGTIYWLHGRDASARKAVLRAAGDALGMPLLWAHLEDLAAEADRRGALTDLFREAALAPALVLLEGGDFLADGEGGRAFMRLIEKVMDSFRAAAFVGADRPWPPDGIGLPVHPVGLDAPSYARKRRAWADALQGRDIPEYELDTLAGWFGLDEGGISKAVEDARLLCGDGIDVENLYRACASRYERGLGAYASRVAPRFGWDDIMLPADGLEQLREICVRVRRRGRVCEEWGFGVKLAGKGINALFSGPSGTGKTMAAEVLAGELRLALYKVDLSRVVSKYIGETEKNLDRVFAAAEGSGAILFFDEADALFGKRTEVRDSHDRYANVETGYLLQKMEEYGGMAVLATNLRENIDAAFVRRLGFIVEFPFPDEERRLGIWRTVFPEDAPLGDIDYPLLARGVKLTGGNIKNIALRAAFLAADEGVSIGMRHISRAAEREYAKLGRRMDAAIVEKP